MKLPAYTVKHTLQREEKRYLSMRVQGGKGCIKHAPPHFSVAVVQSIRDKEEEEWGDLGLLQVLRKLIQGQSKATSETAGCSSIGKNALIRLKLININFECTKHQDLPGLPLVRWGFRNYSA